MRRICTVFVVFLSMGSTLWADSLSIRFGAFVPRGQSDIWEVNREETTLQTSQMIGGTLALSYNLFLGRWLDASLSIGFYEEEQDASDREFVFPDGTPIVRTIHLRITPLEFTLKWLPLGRHRRRTILYIGGGMGLYFWRYGEVGDFVVDRFVEPFIAFGDFRAEGQDIGWHALAGLQVPVGRRTTIDGEVKYIGLNGDLGPDFVGFKPIDLSGLMLTLGLSFWW